MNQQHNGTESFAFIHFLRGIAPIIVLWAHLCGWWLSANNTTSQLQTYWVNFVVKPFHLYQDGGHLGVLIFFLISGFIVTHVSLYETIKEFLIKRFFRIVPTLLLSLLILASITAISQYYVIATPLGNQSNDLKDYIYTLLLISRPLGRPDVLSVTWTLFVEVIFYLMTAVFLSFTKKDPAKATWHFIILLIIIVLISPLHPILKRTADLTIYIFYILIGRIIYLERKTLLSSLKAFVLGSTCFVSFVTLYDYLLPNRMFTSPVLLIYSDIIAIVIFFLAIILVNKQTKIMSFFANISYGIYLFHIPIGSLILNVMAKKGVSFKIALFTSIAFILVFSYIINRFIEIPSQNIARKLLNKN